jgi:hypothetical protein
MQLYGIVPQVVGLLQWAGRISYAALQQEFGLDTAQLETLRRELIFQGIAVHGCAPAGVPAHDISYTPVPPRQ